MDNKCPLVKAKQTGSIYLYHGEVEEGKHKFENITEGRSGVLNAQQSKELFTIPLGLNEMCAENREIINLIKALNLKF